MARGRHTATTPVNPTIRTIEDVPKALLDISTDLDRLYGFEVLRLKDGGFHPNYTAWYGTLLADSASVLITGWASSDYYTINGVLASRDDAVKMIAKLARKGQ